MQPFTRLNNFCTENIYLESVVESAEDAIGKRSRSDGSADEAASSVTSPKARVESEQDRVRKARLARFA